MFPTSDSTKLESMPNGHIIKSIIIISVVGWIFYGFLEVFVSKKPVLTIENAPNTLIHNYQHNTMESIGLFNVNMKYILQWTDAGVPPFNLMGEGRSAFVINDCEFTNCYVTSDKNHFVDYKAYDAIVFNGNNILKMEECDLPQHRGPDQKYVFVTTESSHELPICNPIYDGFFNWTWTYRLDSDVRWGYFSVYDVNDTVVGPSAIGIDWITEYEPLSEDIRDILNAKTKAVAWIVTDCTSLSHRVEFAKTIVTELYEFNRTVDIYGACGKFKCKKSKPCPDALVGDYLFYFSFEKAFAEDYVTGTLLTSLDLYAVPVVYGGADYSRFLPPNSYLDAKKMGAKVLAQTMDAMMKNRTLYEEYHRWRRHYRYERTLDSEFICKMCSELNDDEKFTNKSVYKDFRKWWNTDVEVCESFKPSPRCL